MRTLTRTLEAAQKSSSAVPYVSAVFADYHGDVSRARFERHYTGSEGDYFSAVTRAGDGSLVRARIDPATKVLYTQRVTSPGPVVDVLVVDLDRDRQRVGSRRAGSIEHDRLPVLRRHRHADAEATHEHGQRRDVRRQPPRSPRLPRAVTYLAAAVATSAATSCCSGPWAPSCGRAGSQAASGARRQRGRTAWRR